MEDSTRVGQGEASANVRMECAWRVSGAPKRHPPYLIKRGWWFRDRGGVSCDDNIVNEPFGGRGIPSQSQRVGACTNEAKGVLGVGAWSLIIQRQKIHTINVNVEKGSPV